MENLGSRERELATEVECLRARLALYESAGTELPGMSEMERRGNLHESERFFRQRIDVCPPRGGFEEHLTKPVDLARLQRVLARVMALA